VEALRRESVVGRGWPPPHEDGDDAERAQRIEPERCRQPQCADDETGERRADRTADVDADAVERNRRLQILFGDQRGDDRLPGRGDQRRSGAHEEGEGEQNGRCHPAEPHQNPKGGDDDCQRRVDGDQQLAPIEDVGERASRQSKQHHR
jgi:hypothetical protein